MLGLAKDESLMINGNILTQLKISVMKRTLFILAIIVGAMMVSCNPDDDDSNNNNGGNNGGNNGNGQHNGHEYVDLGLSVKWATCNVGATSPEDYGHYFAWGETRPKAEYTVENSLTCGKQMSDISGNVNYDAATANWGGDWRMPTKEEMKELCNCAWERTTQNGVNVYRVTGPNGNSIFLPAAGLRKGSSLNGAGSGGYYWSSTPHDHSSDYHAYGLYFHDGSESVYGNGYRYSGLSVRPVVE